MTEADMDNDISLIVLLSFSTLLPFLIACGTCYVKFSIVFVMVRNALGLQQIPSNMTLNAVALMLALMVMAPVVRQGYSNWQEEQVDYHSVASVAQFMETGLDAYRGYLKKYSDAGLTRFFDQAQRKTISDNVEEEAAEPSILALMPAYALSEIKSAFKIGFYLYLPFVVIDLIISSVLLALGMMMMSPVTLSVPIKLLLFVMLDGWTLLSKGLIGQYIDLMS